jgi:hypothetical protein
MTVCVVIPVYQDAEQLSQYEKITLRQSLRVLGHHPICLFGPASINQDGYRKFFAEHGVPYTYKVFPEKYFVNISGYSRLLLSVAFYRAFETYEYILICQTDAFVFRDELEEWCGYGYDYIGAPWFQQKGDTFNTTFAGVGNGGFSLRKIASHIKALHSFSYLIPPAKNWHDRFTSNPKGSQWITRGVGFILDYTFRNNTYWLFNDFGASEDEFWGVYVARNFAWFKLPECEQAAAFSFEIQPRWLFALKNQQLPFGCHAWWRYDLDFWKPHIERFGYTI